MFKAGIDGQVFCIQERGGISRIFAELLKKNHYFSQQGISFRPLFEYHRNKHLRDALIGRFVSNHKPIDLMRKAEEVLLSMQSGSSRQIDALYATHYYLEPPTRREQLCKYIISTVHDMTPELYPDFFRGGNPHFNKLKWLDHSDIVICVSESTASDLIDIKPELKDRIRIIRLSCMLFFGGESERASEEMPYFLFVGNRGGYKNAETIIRAFARSRAKKQGVRLLLAGGGRPTKRELILMNRTSCIESISYVNPTDAELASLYRQAVAVLVPSLAEGFSLPLVEALHGDTAVVCSDISVHREIGGKFCHFASPLSVNAWTEYLDYSDHLKRPSAFLGTDFIENCKLYSPSTMAENHASLLHSIC